MSFGALGVLARVAYDDGADPVGVLTVRFAIAAACFVAAVVATGRIRRLPSKRTTAGLALMGVGYLAQSLCYFTAVDHAPPGLVALLLYSYPALVVILGVVFAGLRLTARAAVACAVAVAGTVVIVGPSASGGSPIGIAFGLAAAFVYAAYILIGGRILPNVDALTASAIIMSTAAIGYAVVFALRPAERALPQSGGGWAAALAIALVCTVVAGITFLGGLARVGPADASTLSTVEPVVSVLLSAIVTGEAITGWTVGGGAMVLASVVALARNP